jgi:hypothetical protein
MNSARQGIKACANWLRYCLDIGYKKENLNAPQSAGDNWSVISDKVESDYNLLVKNLAQVTKERDDISSRLDRRMKDIAAAGTRYEQLREFNVKTTKERDDALALLSASKASEVSK